MVTYSRGCEGQFQIAEAAPKHLDDENSDDENDGTSDVWDDVASDGWSSDEVDAAEDAAEDVEEIISPGSYVSFVRGVTISDIACLSRSNKDSTSTSNAEVLRPRDDTQFFRRICLILPPTALYVPITGALPSSASLDDFDPRHVSPEFERHGSDWSATFNPKIKKALDVNLVHTLMHER